MEQLSPRVPPHNNDAEISVLGSVLLDNDVLIQLGDTVAPEMFYREGHRKIFAAMRNLQERGEPVDLVTLSDELTKRGTLDDVGGLTYLIGLSDQVPTSAYAEHYARLVQEKHTLRQLISASSQAMKLAYDGQLPLEDLLDKAEKMIFEVSEQKKKGEQYQAMSEVVHDTFEYITLLHSNKGIPDGVASGFKDLDEQISGLQKGSLNVLAARPSMGKCLTADTLIDVPGTGERITIEEFVQRQEKQVYGLSENGELRVTTVSAWIDSGVKPVRRVTTRTGRVVKTTQHHPFLGVDGWTPLYDLKVGDKLAVPRRLPAFGQDTSWTLERVRLLAYLIVEGGLTQSSPRFTNTDPVLVADFLHCLHTEFPEVTAHQDGIDFRLSRTWQTGERKDRANPLTEWLRELGLWGQSALHQRFPPAVWQFDRPRLAEFLRVLLSCDGTIYALGKARYGRIEFTVASSELARDLHHALMRFGIVAKLRQKTESSWRVELTEARSVAEYQASIGWLGEKAGRVFPVSAAIRSNVGHLPPSSWAHVRRVAGERGVSLLSMARASGEHTGEGFNLHASRGLPQARVARYAAVLDDPHLTLLGSDALYWDEIISIEDLGERQVYDLTVPDGANFVAADICVHNTAFALSIAQNVALRGEKTVAVFSLEMPSVQLALRMLCAEARVDMNRIRSGQLNERDFERLAHAAGRLAEAPMVIDDEPDLTVNALRSKLRRIQAQYGNLGLVVIDYLQLMSGSKGSTGANENRQQEISLISRNLKSIARELEVPVMVLSQLSRAVEQRPNHRPMLSDLRECVTGDTQVNLANGQRVPIRELVGQTPDVLAMSESGQIIAAQSEAVWEVGVRPVFEITTRSGRVLKATGKHRVYQLGGWTTVAELQPGDRLALARRLPEPDLANTWNEDRLALLGQLVGDGSYLKGQPLRFTTASEENSEQVRRAAEMLGSTVKRHEGRGNWHQLVISGNGHRWQAAGVGAWLKALGIFNQRSHEKRLPAEIFGLDNASVSTLLRHLWATDGCIHVRETGGASRVYFATCSEGLARDVAALLLRLGIVARLKAVSQSGGRLVWNVDVSGTEMQLNFLATVGAFGPRAEAAANLRDLLESRGGNPNADTVPREVFSQVRARMTERGVSQRAMAAARGTSYGGASHFKFAPSRATLASYATLLEDESLQALASNDLYWDEILSITSAGDEAVYDLTVPGPASWLADGLVSHNSGAIEQDADIVMFIYRDEYYNKETDQQGIAEIIIGKQRNGPVGTVKLQFHSAHVRFNDLAGEG